MLCSTDRWIEIRPVQGEEGMQKLCWGDVNWPDDMHASLFLPPLQVDLLQQNCVLCITGLETSTVRPRSMVFTFPDAQSGLRMLDEIGKVAWPMQVSEQVNALSLTRWIMLDEANSILHWATSFDNCRKRKWKASIKIQSCTRHERANVFYVTGNCRSLLRTTTSVRHFSFSPATRFQFDQCVEAFQRCGFLHPFADEIELAIIVSSPNYSPSSASSLEQEAPPPPPLPPPSRPLTPQPSFRQRIQQQQQQSQRQVASSNNASSNNNNQQQQLANVLPEPVARAPVQPRAHLVPVQIKLSLLLPLATMHGFAALCDAYPLPTLFSFITISNQVSWFTLLVVLPLLAVFAISLLSLLNRTIGKYLPSFMFEGKWLSTLALSLVLLESMIQTHRHQHALAQLVFQPAALMLLGLHQVPFANELLPVNLALRIYLDLAPYAPSRFYYPIKFVGIALFLASTWWRSAAWDTAFEASQEARKRFRDCRDSRTVTLGMVWLFTTAYLFPRLDLAPLGLALLFPVPLLGFAHRAADVVHAPHLRIATHLLPIWFVLSLALVFVSTLSDTRQTADRAWFTLLFLLMQSWAQQWFGDSAERRTYQSRLPSLAYCTCTLLLYHGDLVRSMQAIVLLLSCDPKMDQAELQQLLGAAFAAISVYNLSFLTSISFSQALLARVFGLGASKLLLPSSNVGRWLDTGVCIVLLAFCGKKLALMLLARFAAHFLPYNNALALLATVLIVLLAGWHLATGELDMARVAAVTLAVELVLAVPLHTLANLVLLAAKPLVLFLAGCVFLLCFVQSDLYAIGFLLAAYVCVLLAVWCFAVALRWGQLASKCRHVWDNYLDLGLLSLLNLDVWASLRRGVVRAIWNNPLLPFLLSGGLLAALSHPDFVHYCSRLVAALHDVHSNGLGSTAPLLSHLFAWLVWFGALYHRADSRYNGGAHTWNLKTLVVPAAMISIAGSIGDGTQLPTGFFCALAYFWASLLLGKYEARERARAEQELNQLLREQGNAPIVIDAIAVNNVVYSSGECPICLEAFGQSGDGGTSSILSCGHVIHKECLDRWLAVNRRCPICRHPQDVALVGLMQVL